jgi:F-box interacting protein
MYGMKKQKKPQPTELPEELVLEILIRLPVKSLRRFKCVSKAWRTEISDPSFIRSHLQFSASRWEQNPTLLITPHTLDRVDQGENWPTTFSSNIRFYQWQQGDSKTTLVHGRDFDGEFNSVCLFAHCDGLVLLPTDTKVYLFNPATRDVLTLPESSRDAMYGDVNLPVGFGRDPRTGMYKVVRSFFRSIDPETGIYYDMGMEVCTVGGSPAPCWREVAVDQPYPVAGWITAQSINGGVYFVIDTSCLKPRPHGILRFSLEDETFSVTRLPDELDPEEFESYNLDVMHGELCLIGRRVGHSEERPLTIWALVEDDGPRSLWEPRYTVYVTDLCHPIALIPSSGGGGVMVIWLTNKLYYYDLQSNELTVASELESLRFQRRRSRTFESAGKDAYFFNVIPYTESLVPLTADSNTIPSFPSI